MSRKKHVMNIGGDLYQADLKNDRLISATRRRGGSILPLGEMTYNPYGDYYRFLYDKRECGIFKPAPDTWRLPEEVILVNLSGETLLNKAFVPQMPRDKKSSPLPLLHVADQSGQPYILPKINIGGHQFFVDTYMLAFLDTLDLSNRIFFHWFKRLSGAERPSMMYNTQTRTIAGISPKEDWSAWVSIELPTWDRLRQLEESENKHLQPTPKKPATRRQQKEIAAKRQDNQKRL